MCFLQHPSTCFVGQILEAGESAADCAPAGVLGEELGRAKGSMRLPPKNGRVAVCLQLPLHCVAAGAFLFAHPACLVIASGGPEASLFCCVPLLNMCVPGRSHPRSTPKVYDLNDCPSSVYWLKAGV